MNLRLLLTIIGLSGCGSAPTHRPSGPGKSDLSDDTEDTEDTEDTDGPCPTGLSLIDDRFCIFQFEAALERFDGNTWVASSPYGALESGNYRAIPADGIVPQGYINADEASAACEASGHRLCTSEEWLLACKGQEERSFPYGSTYRGEACNDTYPGGHPVVDYFGTSDGVWDPTHMNDPGINQQPNTLAAGGTFSACVTPNGVYDLHGNLHEWVSDSEGLFRGGFYADAALNGPGCSYRTTAHGRRYHDYSTGFRCCHTPN